jgi:hypothetical protein
MAAVVVAAALGLGFAACGSDAGSAGSSDTEAARTDTSPAPIGGASALPDADLASIVHMREEEKLARDVYIALGDQWELAIFDNIANAEVQHMDAVATLLDRYDIADPAGATAPGEFTDPDLQVLYDELIEQGSTSLIDALTVGATIEDLDIADLRSSVTSATDVQAVWDSLERGSRNHLRAFTAQLEQRGESYLPQYISQADYDEILASGTETGRTS